MSEQSSGIRAKKRAKQQNYDHPLTLLQEAFCIEYIKEMAQRVPNGAEAAGRAGYRGTRETLYTTAKRLLQDPRVQAVIAKKKTKIMAKLELSAEKVLQEIGRLAFLDPRRFFSPDGKLKPVTELDDDVAVALASMDVTEFYGEGDAPAGVVKKIRFADKTKNLELLGKHFELFTERVKTIDDAPTDDEIEEIVRRGNARRAAVSGAEGEASS